MTTHSSSGVTQSTIGGEARPQRPVSSAENRTAAGLVRLYTAKEAADSLRVSEYWVKERARRREIPFTLVGGAWADTVGAWLGTGKGRGLGFMFVVCGAAGLLMSLLAMTHTRLRRLDELVLDQPGDSLHEEASALAKVAT